VDKLSSRRRFVIVAAADTHAIVWALLGDSRLSPAARKAMTVGSADQIAISAISLVEILYLEERHRLPPGLFSRLIAELATPGSTLAEVAVAGGVVQAMLAVQRADVPDMPDRIIAATAVHLGVPLITRDHKIRASGITTIW
jgi:PIN domain nuclease of toxin-antitoxin system